jgi:anti-sigma factor RsiW
LTSSLLVSRSESMNITSQHISFARLVDLAEGRLPDGESASSLLHISACSRCAGELSRIEKTINLMRTDTAEDAPRDVRFNALNLFRERVTSAKPSVVERIRAALRFDSLQTATAFGVRSGQAAARQMLYSAGDYELDLRVALSGEAWVVSGQVLGECAGGEVELHSATEESASVNVQTQLNELCEFALPPVADGTYTLRLRLSDMEVEVPDIRLRA